jgi:hypothetical protein
MAKVIIRIYSGLPSRTTYTGSGQGTQATRSTTYMLEDGKSH